MAQDNTRSADIVLRFATVQPKPPFTPAVPPTLLTWTRQGITAVTLFTSRDNLLLLYIPKTSWFHDFFSEIMVWVDHCYCTFKKYYFTLVFFSLRNNVSGKIRTKNFERLTWENDTSRNECIRYNDTLFTWTIYRDQKKWKIVMGK